MEQGGSREVVCSEPSSSPTRAAPLVISPQIFIPLRLQRNQFRNLPDFYLVSLPASPYKPIRGPILTALQ